MRLSYWLATIWLAVGLVTVSIWCNQQSSVKIEFPSMAWARISVFNWKFVYFSLPPPNKTEFSHLKVVSCVHGNQPIHLLISHDNLSQERNIDPGFVLACNKSYLCQLDHYLLFCTPIFVFYVCSSDQQRRQCSDVTLFFRLYYMVQVKTHCTALVNVGEAPVSSVS